jgi:hypothetical protein
MKHTWSLKTGRASKNGFQVKYHEKPLYAGYTKPLKENNRGLKTQNQRFLDGKPKRQRRIWIVKQEFTGIQENQEGKLSPNGHQPVGTMKDLPALKNHEMTKKRPRVKNHKEAL